MRLNLIKARANKNKRLVDVAEAVNISKSMICDIEKGRRNPSWELQQRLVNYFGIPAEILLAVDESV